VDNFFENVDVPHSKFEWVVSLLLKFNRRYIMLLEFENMVLKYIIQKLKKEGEHAWWITMYILYI